MAKTLNAFSRSRGPYFARTHLLDSQVGTHVVLPSFSLPPPGFDNARYSSEVRAVLAKFESRFGPRGHSEQTLEKTPLEAMLGEARVIDVRALIGTTKANQWPASPIITIELVKKHEAQTRPLAAGEVVIFHSGHSDKHFKPLPPTPELDGLFAVPLAGKDEGWPAPAPEVIAYLADRGIRCVGTDGPTLGGVNAEHSLWSIGWRPSAAWSSSNC